MPPRPSTRNDPSRVHERPPDPAEAAGRPLTSGPRRGQSNPVREPDPTADSDPYEREDEAARARGEIRLEGRKDPRHAAHEEVRGDPGDSLEQRGQTIDPDADPGNLTTGVDDVRPPADS